MDTKENILGTEKISRLLVMFGVPGVISMVVNSIYNIVDQIFIGQTVGYLGNGATNVVMPMTMLLMAFGVLLGDGGAAYMSLMLGQGKRKNASEGAVAGILGSFILGCIYCAFSLIFLKPICTIMGATDAIMPYALEYGRIIAFGFPFGVICLSVGSVIRADGNPRFAMIGLLVGCGTNIVLDALFVIVFKWGVAGAAWATIIGEAANAILNIIYMARGFKTIDVNKQVFRDCFRKMGTAAKLGISSFILQIATIVAVVLQNNALVVWGAQSEYGSDIPIAAIGVTMKVFMVMMSVVMGIAIGAAPIYGYNYGSGRYDRVKKTYWSVVIVATIALCVAFVIFQLFPLAIVSIFGADDETYTKFAVRCLRIFLFGIPVAGPQMVTGGFFQAVGKPVQASVISMSRQVLFLVPLILILPQFFGVEGLLYVGPLGDIFATILSLIILKCSWKGIFSGENKIE